MAWADPTSITTLEGFETAIATEGDYVLNADIDALSTEAQVSAAVTINLNGHTLTTPAATCSMEYQGDCFMYDGGLGIIYGATLTLTGSGTLNGSLKILDDNYEYIGTEPAVITFNNQFTGTFDGMINDDSFGTASISIRGGSFTFDPSDLLEDDCDVTENEGVWTVQSGIFVARVEVVGGEQYSSLQAAFAAAPNGSTVRLLKDIKLDYSGIETEYPLNNVDGIIKVTNDITLDLNSHNITFKTPGEIHDEISAINIFNGGKLTIIGDGQVVGGYNYALIQPFTEESSYSAVFGVEVDEDYNPLGQLVLRGGTYEADPSDDYNYSRYGTSLEDEVEIEDIQEGFYNYYKLTYNDENPAGLLRAYLTGESSATHTVTEDINLISSGVINISGTKTLSVNEGVTVAFKNNSPAIVVPSGATLNLKGKGTLSFIRDIIKVEEGGTLVIGDANSTDALTITSSFSTGSFVDVSRYYAIDNYGTANIYRANITSRKNAIQNHATGKMIVKNARIIGQASSSDFGTNQHAYSVINSGTMVLADTYVQGIHGAVACQSGNGTLELRNCDLRALNNPEKTDAYYALYVCTNAMVSAYNTKFYSQNASNTIYVGDDDAYNTFGLIYLYDGCKSNRKLFVQQKRGQDNDLLFPVLLSEESAWYKVALREEEYVGNDDRLLPANVEYQEINEAIDGLTYLFATHSTAADEKSIDSNDPTIPWQQNTTWTGNEVPETTTAVVIPAGKVVVVSNDPEITGTGANKDTAAVAEQIFIGDGAKLTVTTGTTLTVGEGGINVANGGQIVVEPGAVVTVGSAGLVTTEEEALVISANTEDQGVFLLKPEVTENTQPKATVKLISKAKQVGENDFIWERFAIPTIDGNATIYDNERLDTVTIYNNGAFAEGLAEWNGSAWVGVSSWKNLQPFKGYQLTNNSKYGNVCYTFEGNLVGNADRDYEFTESGFGFFGNSYTGDIDILKLITGFDEESQMQKSVWIYDPYTDGFKVINESNYGKVYYGQRKARHGQITDIRTMQAFLMNSFKEGDNTATVDYSSAIWGNPKYGLVSTPDPAPAKRVAANEDMFTVYVAGAKQEDEVSFIRSNAYSAAFDNGADASKWMNNGLNLYVATEDGELAAVASDEIVDMTIAFQSGNETEYTLGFDNLRGEQFELRDVLTGATIQMTEGATYTFSQEANTTVPARFQIIGAKKVTTGIENMEEGATVQQKVVKNGVLYILRDNKWYNAQGQFVK